jgi:hypothetical protein
MNNGQHESNPGTHPETGLRQDYVRFVDNP